ncbi:Gfo/Idh/MocA family oxidoreductase [Nonomuraea sp. NBC_01738]|uniref:Gfo/Idh/MocA family protein n=1 Tax=Nonomuraea sp. NBC_01738 TaxID=2976003 RepID=UPI002E0E8B76|nr:Gfo/Idh/MocA family oxidoreductase [Nonomuraea sp. NBC_01738]
MRVALVGLGDIGTGAHLPALHRHPEIDVTALVDPRVEHRTADDMGEILGDVDGVVLATPPWVTPSLVVRAAAAGRFVLAEKPVAVSVAEAEVYDRLTPEQRDRVQVGLTYRHDPALVRLREWIDRGVLGGPLLVRAHIYDERRDPDTPGHTARIEEALGHGPPVIHEGAHVFDWLSYLLAGPPDSIDDAWQLRSPSLGGARLRYPRGIALVEFGWLTDALPRCELSVLGPHGHATLGGRDFRLRLTTALGTQEPEFPGDRTTRCFDLQLRRFADLMAGRTATPSPSLADGIEALRVCEQVARAAG